MGLVLGWCSQWECLLQAKKGLLSNMRMNILGRYAFLLIRYLGADSICVAIFKYYDSKSIAIFKHYDSKSIAIFKYCDSILGHIAIF